ncbi:BPTD_3080 family restriction endonuclease [Blastococcus sp. TF02A-26]|uniref:BPTD_3080 family restriction endonuclease n=1 Tax=Blastococcus sp. TF02A-26 TaxID=2250577 RepID=UPI000DEA5BF8|nr:DEAD/DEAH box helicase family protein [Blastococcus sp. TF02A-26]RBY86777.1 restriction endonuclease subunit R [Blastococcus sp. TF02A-26]
MAGRDIDNPILNSPFTVPARHWRFDDEGITNEVVEGRRASEYFVPVPQARRSSGQLSLGLDWTLDRRRANDQVNLIRAKLDVWRRMNRPGITPTSRRLLSHWLSADRARPLFFCQVEALETAIWITEVAGKGDAWVANALRESNEQFNDALPRLAHKMATGSGKTMVMAMLIAWHTCNKAANPQDRRFSDAFLVVAPGITIRDRLRVLLPTDPNNYYRSNDLVPLDLESAMSRARVSITIFHAFKQREAAGAVPTGRLAKSILTDGGPDPFIETPEQMARRVCRELVSRSRGKRNIVVLNDEAHHCWQGPESTDGEKLTAEERKEAEARRRDARLWINGLKAVNERFGIRQVYDLSATPFFLKGSGFGEGTLFPWTVSDFSLIDAIEAGIVKIPRLPVADNAAPADMPTYRDLWPRIREGLPKKSRKALAGQSEPELPDALKAALHSLYSDYERSFRRWEDSDRAHGSTPPVFIVVCNNTAVSKLVYDYVAGWEKLLPDGETKTVHTGALDLLRNDDERGNWLSRPRSILVDSQQLESGEGMSSEFKQVAAKEIAEFRAEYRERFPGRNADALTDEDILREVLNTVGSPGRLGEQVRCVVSVSMLTEGWDANTVTHVLGVRAFGTQLLCEQVVGRALRRRSYAVDEESGHFAPEYAEVYGVPFSFIASSGTTRETPTRPVVRVRALSERSHLAMTFPRVTGYRYDIPDQRLVAAFAEDSQLRLTVADLPTETEVRGVVGEREFHRLEDLEGIRPQSIAYELARSALVLFRDEAGGERPWLFPQLLRIAREWVETQLQLADWAFPGLVLLDQRKAEAVQRIYQAVVRGATGSKGESPRLLPILRPYDPIGTTDAVSFDTTRRVYETDPDRCHINYVTLDSGWEQTVARALEATHGIEKYVKNDRLGFHIPYAFEGQQRTYEPDFIAALSSPEGGKRTTLIVEVTGERRADKAAKVTAAKNLWLPAINNYGEEGRWDFLQITDPTSALSALHAKVQDLLEDVSEGAA